MSRRRVRVLQAVGSFFTALFSPDALTTASLKLASFSFAPEKSTWAFLPVVVKDAFWKSAFVRSATGTSRTQS